MPDNGHVRHIKYEHWICFATAFCMHRLELQTWTNGKLMAALEGVLARLDLNEDTQDRLEQRNFDNAKSVAAFMLCIPEHGRMCAHDVKVSCFWDLPWG